MKGEAQATGEGDGSDYSDRDRQRGSYFHIGFTQIFFACKGEHKSDFFVVEYFQLESLKCLKKKID